MPRRAPKEYRKTKLIVAGKGHFPTDMLRHDSCTPWNNKDVVLIQGFSTLTREIVLARFSLDGSKVIADKWSSFGWTVIYDDGVE